VLTGALHGLFIGMATVVAARIVAPERRGQAMGVVFGGIAVSSHQPHLARRSDHHLTSAPGDALGDHR
jgi:hypothetical protein